MFDASTYLGNTPFKAHFLCLLYSFYCQLSPVNCSVASTTVERALQIRPFMQNKANFRKSQMNVNKVLTKVYDQLDTWSIGKNKANSKPIQTQYKPNSNPNKPNLKILPQRVGRTKGLPLVMDVAEMKNIYEPYAGRIVNNVRLISFGILCRETAGLVVQEVLSIEQGTLDFQYRERG